MANQKTLAFLKDVMKRVFVHGRMALDSQQMDAIKLSVGARIQGNQDSEVIITQTGHTVDIMKNGAATHTYTVNLIAFSKDYTFSALMCDELFYYFSNITDDNVVDSQAFNNEYVRGHYFPKSQTMYYTDEDDFASSLTMEVRVIDETYKYTP